MQTRSSFACLATLLLLGLSARLVQAQTHYTLTDLGHLPGASASSAWAVPTAINNNGQVVGWADTGQLDFIGFPIGHAFLWDAVHGIQDLGTFSSNTDADSSAVSINDAGQILGNASFSYTNEHHGWLLSKGAVTLLETALSPFQTTALALNNSGQVIGSYDNDMQIPGVFGFGYFLWQNGSAAHLPDISSHGSSVSYVAINDKGQIAGNEFTRSGGEGLSDIHTAFLLQGNTFTYVQFNSTVFAFNNVGQVMLNMNPLSLWTPTTPNGTSGSLAATGDFYSYALSDAGQAVGFVYAAPGDSRAAIYDAVHGIQRLDDLIPANSGWTLQNAYATNQKGQIVGVGFINNLYHGFLLTPDSTSGGGTTQTALAEVRLGTNTVMGGLPVAGRVVLNQAAPSGGVLVTLATTNTAATVPASIKVAAGATFADFAITTGVINPLPSVQGNITATYNGTTKSAPLTVTPLEVKSLTLKPARVRGGNISIGTITLAAASPTGGLVVTLSSSKSTAAVPASVRVPAGSTTKAFALTTQRVRKNTNVLISATAAAQPVTATLTITR